MAIAGHVSRKMLSRYSHIRTEAKRSALEEVVANREKARALRRQAEEDMPTKAAHAVRNPQSRRRLVPRALLQPRDICVNFVDNKGLAVQAMALDCRTMLGPQLRIQSAETLRRLLAYLGATPEQLADFDSSHRRWGQGTVQITLQPCRKNLLRIDYHGCEMD